MPETTDIREALAEDLQRQGLMPDVSGDLDALPANRIEPQPDDDRAAFCLGLAQIAVFLQHHPDVPLPYLGTGNQHTGTRHVLMDYIFSDEPREQLAAITRHLADGGKVHKRATEGDHAAYLVWREFGPIALAFQADRDEVCERVVVGTERVEVEVDACPVCKGPLAVVVDETQCATDKSHYRAVKPARRVATTEREIVEWRCTPLLADQDTP